MAIYRRGDTWWLNIYRGAGRARLQVSLRTASKEKARLIEASYQAARAGQLGRARMEALLAEAFGAVPGAAAGLALEAAWEVYGADGGVCNHTSRAHWRRLTRWLAEHQPQVREVAEVTRPLAFAFAEQARREVSPKSWNNLRGTLARMWVLFERRHPGLDNPWRAVPTADTAGSRHGRAFTAAEVAAILAECRSGAWCADWYGASLIALYTGLRQGDIAELRWDQVQDGWLVHTPKKTRGHGIRVRLPLHPELAAWLAEQPRPSERILPLLHDHLRTGKRQTDYPRLLAAAGVQAGGHKLSFHCWRHTFRTALAAAGVPAEVARKLGGWRTDVAERVYDHDLTQARAAIDRLPGLATGTAPTPAGPAN